MIIPNLKKYTAGTTSGATATLTPTSGKRIFLSRILGFNDKADIIEIRNALTGTVATTSGSPTVTGTSTLFTTELEVGDAVRVTTNGEVLYVSSIASATSFTATANSGNTQSTTAATRFITEIGTPTEVNHPIDHKFDGEIYGSIGKALDVVIVDSTADCALTIFGYER